MKKQLTAEEWLRGIFEYERTHEIAFASPRALVEAPLNQREANGNGKAPGTRSCRKAVAA